MTIREAKPEDAVGIAKVHVASWRTTYPGIMPQIHLEALSVEDFTQTWTITLGENRRANTCTFVALSDTGEIIGFASGGPERSGDAEYASEIYSLYLQRSQQRRGIGRRLTAAMARKLFDTDYRTLLIWVNAHNPARHFYEALGGVAARTGQREIQGVTYDDIGYGWNEASFRRLMDETVKG